MILVLSDLHLGYKKCNREAFLAFLDEYDTEVDDLVLLGDIFDFWRRNNARVVEENEQVMVKINGLNAKNVHYIAGNHDYYLLNLNKRYEDMFTVSRYLRLENGGESFFFVHGYELEAILWEFPASLEMYEKFSNEMCYNRDASGTFLSKIWDIRGYLNRYKQRFIRDMDKQPHQRDNIDEVYNLAVSNGKYFLLGMKPHEKLVFGHTHRPFISNDNRVVNTGSWIDELESKEYQNSYVEIDGGNMELKFFKTEFK